MFSYSNLVWTQFLSVFHFIVYIAFDIIFKCVIPIFRERTKKELYYCSHYRSLNFPSQSDLHTFPVTVKIPSLFFPISYSFLYSFFKILLNLFSSWIYMKYMKYFPLDITLSNEKSINHYSNNLMNWHKIKMYVHVFFPHQINHMCTYRWRTVTNSFNYFYW